MKISGGMKQDGIVTGNTFDKYQSRNPLVRQIMRGFAGTLSQLVARAAPASIHEVGCGEGYWVLHWRRRGLQARGSDFSSQVIDLARDNARALAGNEDWFSAASIYDLQPQRDSADLIVCCEVLEHLEHPEQGLQALQRITGQYLILSVPREPLWRILNMARGKYLADFGNTPGHIQHWSRAGFVALASRFFEVVEVRSPLPWTMLLCRPRDSRR